MSTPTTSCPTPASHPPTRPGPQPASSTRDSRCEHRVDQPGLPDEVLALLGEPAEPLHVGVRVPGVVGRSAAATCGCSLMRSPRCRRRPSGRQSGGSAGCSAGSSAASVRTGPGGVRGPSKRTVTRPSPRPHTQPAPSSSCRTSWPGHQRVTGSAGHRLGGTAPRRRAVRRRARASLVLGEQVALRVERQPGDADARAAAAPRPCRPRRAAAGRSPRSAGRRPWAGQGQRAGQRREVVAAQLERHRAAREGRRPQPAAHAGRHRVDLGAEHGQVGEVPLEGLLRRHRLRLRGRRPPPGRPRPGPARTARRRAPGRPAPRGRAATWPRGRPTVRTPTVAAAPPSPDRRRPSRVTGRGCSTSSSSPVATTTRPSGLSRSEPILAISFEVPTPTEPVTPPVAAAIRSFSRGPSAVTPVHRQVERRRRPPGRRRPRRATPARPAATARAAAP